MKRTLYAYNINVFKSAGQRYLLPDDILSDVDNALEELLKKTEVARKEEYKTDNKILYLDAKQYDEEEGILILKFVSAKYNSKRVVIDTETMKERGILKGDKDGDKEKNHIAIKYTDDSSGFVCLYEWNSNGIGCKKIIHYIEKMVQAYHKKKEDNIKYRFESKSLISMDFIQSLDKMHKISAVTLTVDYEDVKVSELKDFSGKNDLSQDVDIVLKRNSPKIGIFRQTVKEFYELYNDKNKKIKRITVKGENDEEIQTIFNTERMKEKVIVEVSTEIGTGEVDSGEIMRILKNEVKGISA